LTIEDLNIDSLKSFGRAANFEPKGYDVECVKYLLALQSVEIIIKIIFFQKFGIFVAILQAFFTVPLISLSSYLFLRFKKAFSKTNMKNLIKISTLMLFENGLMTIL